MSVLSLSAIGSINGASLEHHSHGIIGTFQAAREVVLLKTLELSFPPSVQHNAQSSNCSSSQLECSNAQPVQIRKLKVHRCQMERRETRGIMMSFSLFQLVCLSCSRRAASNTSG